MNSPVLHPGPRLFDSDSSYSRDLEGLYVGWNPTPVPAPRLVILNRALAEELRVDPHILEQPAGVDALAGNLVPAGASPLAQAYAGHQFGQFSNPLGDPAGRGQCVYPWPSDVMTVADPATATDRRVQLDAALLPRNIKDQGFPVALTNDLDGFSPNSQIRLAFAAGVDAADLPGIADIGASIAADAKIVLVQADSGGAGRSSPSSTRPPSPASQ